MKKISIALLLVFVVGGAYYFMNQRTPAFTEDTMPAGGTKAPPGAEAMVGGDAAAPSEVKEFTLNSFEFGYDQKTLTVNAGDTVTITLTNSGKMSHDWVVDEFDAKTKQIKNGEIDTITFVAGAAGTYEFYCSVGQHRANGMVGQLVVQ